MRLDESTLEMINERLNTRGLSDLRYQSVSNNTLKPKNSLCGVVHITKHSIRDEADFDFFIELNEAIFDRLSEKDQLITLDRLLAYIVYDMENDKLRKETADIQEHSGVITKYGYDTVWANQGVTSQIWEEVKEEEKAKKRAKR